MTYVLKLFHQSDPARLIDARPLKDGELAIGREPVGGWRIDDPDRQISRHHCTVAVRPEGLTIRDASANGMFFVRNRERLPAGEFVPLALGESVALGKFMIVAEPGEIDQAPLPAPSAEASPFAPPPGIEPRGVSRPAPVDPFAAELRRSPLDMGAATPFHADDRGVRPLAPAMSAEDAWMRRDPGRAGDWDAPVRAPDHETLIGSAQTWSELPKEPLPEIGFGFDAPFHRPMLRADPIPSEALMIPSDWDAPSGAPPAEEPSPAEAALEPPPEFHPPAVAPEPPPPVMEQTAPTPAAPTPPPAPMPPLVPPTVAAPEPPALPATWTNDALLEAFCRGANLDPAELAGQDPAAVMERAGAVYRQMVLGLVDLLGERTSLKNEYRMSRTTVAPEGNNPFKWAPARRVAVDLLKGANEGFISGPAAVRDSFEDLKKHLLCLLAGMRASVAAALDALAPAAVEVQLKGQSFMIPSRRAAAAWTAYSRLHAAFRQAADDNPDSQINRDFRAAYERQLEELDGLDARN